MPVGPVDICNLALGRLGQRANITAIDPPDGTPAAAQCARFYPMARDTALASHAWSFATTRLEPPQYATPVIGWAYAYVLPADVIEVLGFVEPNGLWRSAYQTDFEREVDPQFDQFLLLTNRESAAIRYTRRVTDTTLFSPMFVDALSWLLASHIAGPIINGGAGAKASAAAYQAYQAVIAQAKVRDANQTARQQVFTPSTLGSRGISTVTRDLPGGYRTEAYERFS
jgi:hypothetical protein